MAKAPVWKTKRGNLDKTFRDLAKVKSPELKVGVLEGSTYPNGLSVAQVAYWQEFGTTNIPARAPFRTAISQNKDRWVKDTVKAIQHFGLNNEDSIERAFDLLGQMVRDDIRGAIDSNLPPPLKESTIKAKESALKRKGGPVDGPALNAQARTLIQTGTLRREINYSMTVKK